MASRLCRAAAAGRRGAHAAGAAAAAAGAVAAAGAAFDLPGRARNWFATAGPAAHVQPFLQAWAAGASPTPVLCEEGAAARFQYGSCRLRDGRVLAYHEEGSGVPVFAFHGMGSSRLTWVGQQPLSEICPGVRLIAVDRPGYGGSSSPPFGYSYSAFTRDLAELADQLGLPRFCVAGHSSGGPYALAAASELGDRVVAAAAISSDAPYAHLQAPPELREADDFAYPAATTPIGLYGREVSHLAESMRSDSLKGGNPIKAHAWKCGTDGWVCDYTLERIPWSFAVEDITLGPRLSVWVGSEDIEAIKIGSPFLHGLVRGSQLRVVDGGNHGFKSKPEHLAAILGELRAQSQLSVGKP